MGESIRELIGLMRDRKSSQQYPYVLLLGAGASMPSGLAGSSELTDAVVGECHVLEDERIKAFEEKGSKWRQEDQYSILKRLLKAKDVSQGYRDLARLVSLGYFDFNLVPLPAARIIVEIFI